ncbi:MAG: DEAD/DEAH box helicase [Clostridia bacterium]|nr:DEAD/DEAH box helicase [Clostridia bacterium]
MYIMKDVNEFFSAHKNGEVLQYGKNLKFVPIRENFERNSQELFDFIIEHGKMLEYNKAMYNRFFFNSMFSTGKSIRIIDEKIDNFFELMKDRVIIASTYNVDKQEFLMCDEEMKIELNISESVDDFEANVGNQDNNNSHNEMNGYELSININGYDYVVTNKNVYVFLNNKIYTINKNKNKNIEKILKIFRNNKTILIPKDKEKEFSKYVMPEITNYIDDSRRINNTTAMEGLIVNKLASKIYLDLDSKDNIMLELKFCYKDYEFNILDKNYMEYVKEKNIVRDVPKEREVLKRIFEDGFELSSGKNYFTLKNQDDTYEFLSEKVATYMNDFEVLATDKFKNKKVKFTNISNISIKLDNGLLELDISKVDINLDEIKDVLKNYNIKKKYYKLKSGDYINLQKSEGLDFLNELSNNLEIKYDKINNGVIKLPANRSLYLEQLLRQNNKISATKNDEYTKLVNNIEDKDFSDNIKVEKDFENILRDYQKTGYKWLKVLEHYKFGGILADDMGLGKTLQVIALIASELKSKKNKPSIVVCPSSLVLNWKAEIEKWCKEDIKILVIKGDAESRKQLINSYKDYNLVITSYDLLKRDVDEYEKKVFKYVIADEAQYIKNFATQNATALKSLEGEIKLALTGTPIENSISELWSIFDFIMPGYLYNYNKFKNNFEMPILKDNDETAMKKLKQLISPFILRRVKSEVLTELPEKNITIMNNEMTSEQEKLYLSYFAQTKNEIVQELKENGFEKSKFKILMLLTRLRQICCHPSLFISNYTGESGKLNQCMDIISEAISSGHKILLFSGYTSMFEIIEEKLKEKNIEYFKLTGSTPVDKRVEMVEQFNNNANVKIFLISLKAGGTGLNLTGADVVIHYDPWWNVSAENQATDRAYRIGQKNSVQVYKLITNNSIEEKINKLQEKKAKISEQLLSTKETFINKLSREEIMELFE